MPYIGTNMKNPLKTLDANLIGSDYVIGDLHGSYTILQNLLNNINFDYTKDRMISVGDVIDRGPDSLKCLSLIREPWFHATLANHEQMMLHKFNGGRSGAYWFHNGGEWAIKAYNDFCTMNNPETTTVPLDTSLELFDLLPLVEELPFLITVNTKSGKKFHILHAEFASNHGIITDADLAVPATVYKLATIQRGDGDAFLWARALFGNFYKADLSNRDKIIRTVGYWNAQDMFTNDLSHIISGHTILQRPVTIVGQTNIDTYAYGAYWTPASPYSSNRGEPKPWCALTCIELDTWKFYQATETTFKEVEPFVVSREDLPKMKPEY